MSLPNIKRTPRLLRITRKLPRSSLARIPLRLSLKGEVFTFTLSAHPAIDGSPPTHPKGHGATSSVTLVEPQSLWALRKQFSVARDVALGADETVILCTESGHVYDNNISRRVVLQVQQGSRVAARIVHSRQLERIAANVYQDTGEWS